MQGKQPADVKHCSIVMHKYVKIKSGHKSLYFSFSAVKTYKSQNSYLQMYELPLVTFGSHFLLIVYRLHSESMSCL